MLSTAARTSLKIIQDLMRLQGEAPRAHGQVIALVGNHEAMNMTGDLRYVSAADYAAYADSRSAQRRENVYEANKAAIEAAYRQHDPQMTSDAIKQAWFAATPLGSIEHQIAWGPNGKIGRWIVGNPAVVVLDGTLFVHGGISPAYAHMPIAEINSQVAAALVAQATDPQSIINDPLGPLWYRGLATPGAGRCGRSGRCGRRRRPDAAAPPEPPVEEQLDESAARLWRQADRDRPHPDSVGNCHAVWRAPDPHRYRHIVRLWRRGLLSGNSGRQCRFRMSVAAILATRKQGAQ